MTRTSVADLWSQFTSQVWIPAIIDVVLSVGFPIVVAIFTYSVRNIFITAVVACVLQAVKIFVAVIMMLFQKVHDKKQQDNLVKVIQEMRNEHTQKLEEMRNEHTQKLEEMRNEFSEAQRLSYGASQSNAQAIHAASQSNAQAIMQAVHNLSCSQSNMHATILTHFRAGNQ